MPALAEHHSTNSVKLLYVGDSGAGKTGSLASLASAGYNLRIIDMDNGLDVLKNMLTDPKSPYDKSAVSRVQYVTFTEQMKNVNGKLIPLKAIAWQNAISMLQHWKEINPETKEVTCDLGPVASWGENDILVIDSLTFISNAAMNLILSINGRLGQRPHQSDWGLAQDLVEGLLSMLYSTDIKCHVIIPCHITYIGEEGGPLRGYPNTLGKALAPKVARYFNNTLMAQTTGQGTNQKRRIKTSTVGVIELKNSAPLRVDSEYPLETGLAQYFKAIRGVEPGKSPA